MSRLLFVLSLVGLIALPVAAQESRVGLGVSIEPSILSLDVNASPALTMPTLYVPFTIRAFRFEPSLGFSRVAVSFGDDSNSATTLRLGAGFFYHRRMEDDAWYIGARAGLVRTGLFDSFDEDNPSRVDYFLAPALGGEHYFGKLSVGVEGQVQYVWVGNANENGDVSTSIFQTRALFFLRYHFGSWNSQ